MKKRILLISNFCPPVLNAESILVWKTVRQLSVTNDVVVLTADMSGRASQDGQLVLPENVRVIRTRSYKPASGNWRKIAEKALGAFVDEQFLWAALAPVQVPRRIDCDVIYSRSQPGASHILARRLKRVLKKPWIAQFSDPWASNPYHTHHTKLRQFVDAYFERRVIEEADALVFPTVEILNMVQDSYPELSVLDKSTVLPHHFAPEFYQHGSDNPSQSRPKRTFTYVGDFYGIRSPEPLISALQVIAQTSPEILHKIRVRFLGNVESKFHRLIEQAPIEIERGKASYLESLKAMTDSAVLLLIDAPSPNGINPFLPSKLMDYLGAGRPILGITDVNGTAANILRKYNHIVVSPTDVRGIVNAIMDLASQEPHSTSPPAEFTSEHVVGQLSSLMDKLVEGVCSREQTG